MDCQGSVDSSLVWPDLVELSDNDPVPPLASRYVTRELVWYLSPLSRLWAASVEGHGSGLLAPFGGGQLPESALHPRPMERPMSLTCAVCGLPELPASLGRHPNGARLNLGLAPLGTYQMQEGSQRLGIPAKIQGRISFDKTRQENYPGAHLGTWLGTNERHPSCISSLPSKPCLSVYP